MSNLKASAARFAPSVSLNHSPYLLGDLVVLTQVCVLQMWVAEPSQREDLRILVLAYLQGTAPKPPVDSAVDFYLGAKAAAVSSQGTDKRVYTSQHAMLRMAHLMAEDMVSHDADCTVTQTLAMLAAHISHSV